MEKKFQPYLKEIFLVKDRIKNASEFPFTLPILNNFHLKFDSPVTFLVGENGSGKSTLLEAIASLCGFPEAGGGKNDANSQRKLENESSLAYALKPSFSRRPKDGYFFRAEFMAHFASLLDEREKDVEFAGDPYQRYGGKSLHARSHGEAFLAILQNRLSKGLFILDEPESALSPQRQIGLLAHIAELVSSGETQIIVATHSPILMTYPNADLVSLDRGRLEKTTLEETDHFRITHGILSNPEAYWKKLLAEPDEDPA